MSDPPLLTCPADFLERADLSLGQKLSWLKKKTSRQLPSCWRFDAVDERLDKIQKLMLTDHKRRIERLKTEVKDLKELLAVQRTPSLLTPLP